MCVIGVDIGGSHITAAAIDTARQEIIYASRIRMRVNAAGDAKNILHVWSEAVRYAIHAAKGCQVLGIGIAMPGPFDYKQGISHIRDLHKYDALYGMDIRQRLSESLGLEPEKIIFENDAACYLLGEVINGAAKGSRNAIGLTLGTGLGSAFYKDGKLEEGTLYKAPFRDSIAEEFLSTRWFVRRYDELTGREVRDVKELVQQIRVDRTAQLVIAEFGESLTEFIAPYLEERKPDVLVIGGNIAHTWDLFIDPLIAYLQSSSLPTRVVKSVLGENANLLGAAGLVEMSRHE